MSTVEGAIQWLVTLVSVFPVSLQPGALLVILLLIMWCVTKRHRTIWNWMCRTFAILADLLIGLSLLPEFILTTARRKRGEQPKTGTLVLDQIAQRALDGMVGLYEGHPAVQTKGRFPWFLAAVLVIVPFVCWLLVVYPPPSAELASAAQTGWSYWEQVDMWAGVSVEAPAGTLAPSPTEPAPPTAG